jgi:hypothetical protein
MVAKRGQRATRLTGRKSKAKNSGANRWMERRLCVLIAVLGKSI